MRFPLGQTIAVARHIAKNKRAGIARFPLVLMLEPLHACNLKCAGCGRIEEYADTLSQQMQLETALRALNEVQAPVVSICGGEPLLYRDIETLVREALGRRRVVYLCTNGTILDWRIDAFKAPAAFGAPHYSWIFLQAGVNTNARRGETSRITSVDGRRHVISSQTATTKRLMNLCRRWTGTTIVRVQTRAAGTAWSTPVLRRQLRWKPHQA